MFTNCYDVVRQAVDDCVSSCSTDTQPDGCPLIISGPSQGGGPAIILRDYNPITINFGGMRAIMMDDEENYPCTDLDRDRQFLFVNTNNCVSNKLNIHDAMVMQQYPPNAIQVGQRTLMDDINYPRAHTGLDDSILWFPVSFLVGVIFFYERRIQQMLEVDEQCHPIPVGHSPKMNVEVKAFASTMNVATHCQVKESDVIKPRGVKVGSAKGCGCFEEKCVSDNPTEKHLVQFCVIDAALK